MDQFEELFTLCKDEKVRAGYIKTLLAACDESAFGSDGVPCTVILTVRADFYAQCIGLENLRAALATHQKPIGAMSRDELQRTVELPAQAGQWAFQQGLVEQILDDVGDQPGNLPLLSYALLETWKRRSGRVMTLAGYQAAGGVDKAISRTADRVFHELSRQGLGDVARRILLSLVSPSDESRATRRREQLRALMPAGDDSPEAKALLALSACDARLVTVDGDAVQISHEALIAAWPRLGEWLRTYRDDLQLLQGIRDAAISWDAAPEAEKQDVLAHRGGRLEDAVKQRDAGEFPLDERERAYLTACVAWRDQEIEAERKRQEERIRAAEALAREQQRRAEAENKRATEQTAAARRLRLRNRILMAVGAIALVAAVLAGVLGIQAVEQRKLAEANAKEAERQAQAASEALKQIIWYQANLALADLDSRDDDAAAKKLTVARNFAEQTDPRDPGAVVLCGYIAKAFAQVAAGKGDSTGRDQYYAEAERLFKDTLRLDPSNEGALNGLGNVQYARGEPDAAITSYRSAVEANPTYASAYHDLALAYEAKWRADPGHGSNWCTLALAAWRKTHELGSKQPMFSTGSFLERIQDHIDSLETQCN